MYAPHLPHCGRADFDLGRSQGRYRLKYSVNGYQLCHSLNDRQALCGLSVGFFDNAVYGILARSFHYVGYLGVPFYKRDSSETVCEKAASTGTFIFCDSDAAALSY